jgi:hypothetical protein
MARMVASEQHSGKGGRGDNHQKTPEEISEEWSEAVHK